MIKKNKRGLSPVITTMLLVLIVIVIAVIILLWARGFGKEQITKTYEGEEKDISISCADVKFRAELSTDRKILSINNIGSIDIYKVGIKKSTESISKIDYSSELNIGPGQVKPVDIDMTGFTEVQVIPVLLGKNKNGDVKEASCLNEENWQSLTI